MANEPVRVDADGNVYLGLFKLPIAGTAPLYDSNRFLVPARLVTENSSAGVATDNKTRLEDAIADALAQNEAAVVVPGGRSYINFDGGIGLVHGVKIQGIGFGAYSDGSLNGSKLVATGDTATCFTTNDTRAHSVALHNFSLEAAGYTISDGLISGVFQNSIFSRLRLYGSNGTAQHGLRIKHIDDTNFSWVNTVNKCGVHGCQIGLRNYGSDGWYTENYVGGNATNWLEETTGGNWVAGNHIDNAANDVNAWIPAGTGVGMKFQAGAAVVSPPGTTFVGNYMDKNDTAIYIVGSTPGVAFECDHIIALNRIKVSRVVDMDIRDACKFLIANCDFRGKAVPLASSVNFTNVPHGVLSNCVWNNQYTAVFGGTRIAANIPAINCRQWPSGVTAGAPVAVT